MPQRISHQADVPHDLINLDASGARVNMEGSNKLHAGAGVLRAGHPDGNFVRSVGDHIPDW